MFIATNFIYGGVASELYNLQLLYSSTGEIETSAGADHEIETDKAANSSKTMIVSAKDKPLEFDVQFVSEDSLDKYKLAAINNWLFGQKKYQEFHVCQDDMRSAYYNCYFDDHKNVSYGGYEHCFRAKAICDNSCAMSRTITKRYVFAPNTTRNFVKLLTSSDDSDDIIPIVTFTTIGTEFAIINHSYNDLLFHWSGLEIGEKIVCDCRSMIISSSTNLRRSEKFNKQFLRLVPGINNLEILGGVKELKFEYQTSRKVGA